MKTFNTIEEVYAELEIIGERKEWLEFLNSCETLEE